MGHNSKNIEHWEKLLSKQTLHKAYNYLKNKIKDTDKDAFNYDVLEIENDDHTDIDKAALKNLITIFTKKSPSSYSFQPVKPWCIPKANSEKLRPLRVYEMPDRILLKALSIQFEESFLQDAFLLVNNEISFAYSKNTSIESAWNKIRTHITEIRLENTWIFKADIKNFFEHISHDILIEKLKTHFLNKNLVLADDEWAFIRKALSPTINIAHLNTLDKNCQKSFPMPIANLGLPQGNALSPILSNFYLLSFDLELKNKGFRLVRYADDFVVLCKSKEEANAAYCLAKEILDTLKLEIHDLSKNGKTEIFQLANKELTFLSGIYDGQKLKISPKNIENIKTKLSDTLNKQYISVLELLQKAQRQIQGFAGAFFWMDVDKNDFIEIEELINRELYRALHKKRWQLLPIPKDKLQLNKQQRESSGIDFLFAQIKKLKNKHANKLKT